MFKNIHIDNMTFGFGFEPLFKNWTIEIPSGVVLVRCEENRGKTTLLRLLAGELSPQSGQIYVNNTVLSQLMRQDSSTVFYIEPATDSFDQIKVMDFFERCKKQYPKLDAKMLADLIHGLSLTAHQDKPIYMLSAGSKRKVWIAAALASNARIALIDDPTAALDKPSIEFLKSELKKLANGSLDKTIIVAHYDTLDGVPFTRCIDL
ncbi:MAG TPA: ABC transporter [Alcaligenaceae bacterium]|nr:ABC transporter [Alcaligenaceae bacterium]